MVVKTTAHRPALHNVSGGSKTWGEKKEGASSQGDTAPRSEAEQVPELMRAQPAQVLALPLVESRVDKPALALLEFDDAILHRLLPQDSMDLDRPLLADAVSSVH